MSTINSFTGAVSPLNTGTKKEIDLVLTAIRKLIIVPKNAEISIANMKLLVQVLTKIKQTSGNWYPFPLAVNVNAISTEDKFEELPFSGKNLMAQGYPGFEMEFQYQPNIHKKLSSFNFGDWAAYLVDESQNIYGWTDSTGTNIYPFDIQTLWTANKVFGTDSVSQKFKTTIVFEDPEQFRDEYVIQKSMLNYNPLKLDGLTDVTLTTSSPSATGVTVTVKINGILASDPNALFTGLDTAAFWTCSGIGGSISVSGISETSDGVYALTFSSQSAGTYSANLSQVNCTLTDAYPASASASFTISS